MNNKLEEIRKEKSGA